MIGTELISQYLESLTYIGIILLLFSAGLGIPIPEDIILILGGYLVYQEITIYSHTVLAGFVGVVLGDMTMYTMGRYWGNNILKHHRARFIFTERHLKRAREYLRRYGKRTVFIARFITGIRGGVHFIAGTLKMSPLDFIFPDILAALISVPFFIYLGYFFGGHIDSLVKLFSHLGYIMTFIVIAFVIILVLYCKHRKRHEAG